MKKSLVDLLNDSKKWMPQMYGGTAKFTVCKKNGNDVTLWKGKFTNFMRILVCKLRRFH